MQDFIPMFHLVELILFDSLRIGRRNAFIPGVRFPHGERGGHDRGHHDGLDGAAQAARPVPARLAQLGAAHRAGGGAQLEWSEAKIWRIETGQTSLRSLDVETMCRIYGALPDVTEALMGLAKETKARGWWHSYGDAIPEGFDVYIGLEEAASRFSWYESELVPACSRPRTTRAR